MSDFDFIPAGIAICDPTGVITQLNATMLSWLDSSDKREFIGRPFHSILAPAGKIYFETHIRPMLMVEKSVQEISIEIMAPASQRIGVYLNGQVESSETGEPIALHFALFNGQQRYLYELELRERRRAAERHAALVDASPDAIINLDADLKIIGWNAAAITLFGPKEQAGADGSFDSVFESTSKRDELMQTLEALKKTLAWRGETEFLDINGEKLPVEINASIVKNEFGVFAGVVMVVRDIRERRQSEEMIRMLNSEIIHRSNNQFAVIQAIARSTARYSEPQEFIDVFTQRLYALGRSLKLLNERTNNATDLRDLVALQTSHLGPDHTSRIQISGAPLNIAGKTAEAVGLAIFELSTNAVKYGALSEKFTKSGRVLINWDIQDGQVSIRWTESGVEGVSAPTRNGFGSRLTGQLLERTIRGKVRADYNPDGLAWSLTLPEKHLIGI